MATFCTCHTINTGTAEVPVRWQLHRAQADTIASVATTSAQAQRIPLLALHGFSGDAKDFRWLADACADVFDIYALDFLGHGDSDAPASPLSYGSGATTRAIAAALQFIAAKSGDCASRSEAAPTDCTTPRAATPALARQHETPIGSTTMDASDSAPNAEPTGKFTAHLPVLLGYSMGGRMALRYLARYGAETICALVLIGASDGLASAAERRERRSADHALADSIAHDGINAFTERWNKVPLIATQSNSPYFAQLLESRSRNSAHGLANSLRGIGTGAVAPAGSRLAAINAPCLLITGESDSKFAAIAQRLSQQLPDATHCVIPAAGHAAHWENPDAFYSALRNWAEARLL